MSRVVVDQWGGRRGGPPFPSAEITPDVEPRKQELRSSSLGIRAMNVALQKPWTAAEFLSWASTQEGRYEFDGPVRSR